MDQKHRKPTLHWSTHPPWKQNETETSNYRMDGLQKGMCYGPAKLDNKLPQNVRDIRWSHKLHWENHKNLVSGIDSRWEKLSWGGDPERYILRRCTITISICNSADATYCILRKCTAEYKLNESQEKIIPDLIIINKKKRTCKIVDFAVPADHRIKLKECEKKDKYLDLSRELKKLWTMQVTIIPIVIGAFGTVTKGLLKGLEDLEVGVQVETIQTTALLRTARILRRVLETWGNLLSLKLH